METNRFDRDESLTAVREILDMLINQCQNFNDSLNNEKIDLNISNKCNTISTSNQKNADKPSRIYAESRTEDKMPVIRFAKFAVDPSSRAQEEKDNTNSVASIILDANTTDSETVLTDSIGWIESNNTGKSDEGDVEPQKDYTLLDSFAYGALSNEIDLKTDILDDIDDKQIMTINLNDENKPSTSTGFSKDPNIETIYIPDDDDEKPFVKSRGHKVCFKFMEHEKSSFYKLQPRSPNSKPEEYVILTSSVEQEEMIATKLFISKSNFDQIEAQNFGDWVWLMAQLSFCSNDGKSLSRVEIKLQGVPPFNAYIPKNIDEVEQCIQLRANFVLSKKRLTHIFKSYQEISHRLCHRFTRRGEEYFVNCSEVLGLEWIGLMFEYNETVFRRDRYVKKYPHFKQSFVANVERSCKTQVLEQNSFDTTDLSDSNAKLVDKIVNKLEEMIKARLDSRISGIASEITARISNKEKDLQKKNPALNNTELQKQVKPKQVFICPQVHKHKCSQTFTFTSHDDVMKILEHLDIPSEVKDRQYKLLEEQFRKNSNYNLFKECCWNKNSPDSTLFYIFCDAKKYGDIVSEDMLTAMQQWVRPKMNQNLIQYKTLLSEIHMREQLQSCSKILSEIDPSMTAIPASKKEEKTSPSVPLLQFFQCPQKYQHSCSENFAIRTFKDVSNMLRHMEIPKKVMQRQHETLKKIYPASLTSCPLCNCNLLHSDGFYHFEHVHFLVSALFYLFSDDAKVYGDKISSELISVVRKLLPKSMKHHLSTYLDFQLSKNKIYQSQAKKNHELELSSAKAFSKSKNTEDELDLHNEVVEPSGRPQVLQHQQNQQRQPRGRQKGSKNKPKVPQHQQNQQKRPRGRQKGSKNKPKSLQFWSRRGPRAASLSPLATSMTGIANEPRSSTLSGSYSECRPLEEINNVAELEPLFFAPPVSLQKDKQNCPQKFVISSFHDVIKLSDHMIIPPKARGYQLHNLFLMAKEYGRTDESYCPIIFCQAPVKDEAVSHYINQHQIESLLFFLFWDAKEYGYSFPMNLLSSIRKTLAVMYDVLLTDYLKFMQSDKNPLKESITVPKVQVMISDEVTFDIEVLDTNPEVAKSLPSSSRGTTNSSITLPTKSSWGTERNTFLSDASKKKKNRQYSQTRGVVTDAELEKIARNYDESQDKTEINQIKRREIQKLQGSNSKSQEKLIKSFVNNRKLLQSSIASKKGEQRIQRLKKNISKALAEIENNFEDAEDDEDDPAEVTAEDDAINISPEPEIENRFEDDEDDPAEVIAEDDVINISPEPFPLSVVEINKSSKKFVTIENEPRLVSSQTFTSFDEMLGITEDRANKRKSEVNDNAEDPWKRLKSSDNMSLGSESLNSYNRYRIYCNSIHIVFLCYTGIGVSLESLQILILSWGLNMFTSVWIVRFTLARKTNVDIFNIPEYLLV